MSQPLALVVLISGSGSNLQAIIDGVRDGSLPVEIRAVISNRADAGGLERAAQAGIPTQVLSHRDFPSRETYDYALTDLINRFEPGLVVLAGFMRILTPYLVNRFHGRLLNIHPSLLPKYRGLHTHERVLMGGDRRHGASVHFVTPDLDSGPLILQVRVAVRKDDDAASLGARVLRQEHRIYPQVIRWFAEGRLRLTEFDQVALDGGILAEPVRWTSDLPEEPV